MAEAHVDPEVFAGADAHTPLDDGRAAGVEIGASFSAERLRHLEQPRASTRVDAGEHGESLDEKLRENLPERIEPGRSYEDPRIRRTVGVRLRSERASGDGT